MKGLSMDGKAFPPIVNNRVVNSVKGPQQKEMENASALQDTSPPKKKKTMCSKQKKLNSTGLFEAAIAGANREVSMLLSKYAEVLSERAASDAAQVRQLEGILIEARSLETHLQDKKDHLKRTLALISDKLQA